MSTYRVLCSQSSNTWYLKMLSVMLRTFPVFVSTFLLKYTSAQRSRRLIAMQDFTAIIYICECDTIYDQVVKVNKTINQLYKYRTKRLLSEHLPVSVCFSELNLCFCLFGSVQM